MTQRLFFDGFIRLFPGWLELLPIQSGGGMQSWKQAGCRKTQISASSAAGLTSRAERGLYGDVHTAAYAELYRPLYQGQLSFPLSLRPLRGGFVERVIAIQYGRFTAAADRKCQDAALGAAARCGLCAGGKRGTALFQPVPGLRALGMRLMLLCLSGRRHGYLSGLQGGEIKR